MNTDQEIRLRRLFDDACKLGIRQRSAFLDQRCRGEPELRRRLEALLACDRRRGGPLDEPLVGDMERAVLTAPPLEAFPEQLPELIGPYRVVREIGSGSMGTVFEGQIDSSPESVAVKVLRPGVSTESVLRRFQFEVDTLRRLDHPCVARFYGAGTTETRYGPQPYFAMELVRGTSLTRFASEQRLSIRRRLEILAKTCEAVHHAHTRGVIHRDLKPGNIIVDESGLPRIVDFGVARAVHNDRTTLGEQTATGQLVGTLHYMSPEQAAGSPGDIDTRCDIYALGVIGFELLSGTLPYDLAGKPMLEVARIIAQCEPRRLGEVVRTCRGDLETIFAKALEKQRDHRYQSAADLATDLRRFLRDEPVSARPPSVAYQLSKFAKRNRGWFWGAVAALVLLVLGAVGTGYGLVNAVQERERAEAQQREAETARREAEHQRSVAEQRLIDVQAARDESEAVAALLSNILSSASPEELGRDVLLRDVLARAPKIIEEELSQQPLVATRLRHTLATTFKNLGDYENSRIQLEKALETWRSELGPEHPSTLSARSNLAALHQYQGRYTEARALYEETLEVKRRVFGEDHPDVLKTRNNLASVLSSLGRYEDARVLYEATLDTMRHAQDPDDSITLTAMNNLGLLCARLNEFERAESLLKQTVKLRRERQGSKHPSTLSSVNNLAYLYASRGRHEEARALFEELQATHERVSGEDHPNTLTAAHNLAVVLFKQGRYGESAALYDVVIEARTRTLGADHPDTLATLDSRAALHSLLGEYAEAEGLCRQVLDARRRTLGDAHPDTIGTTTTLAVVYRRQGRYLEAERLQEQSLQAARDRFGDDHESTLTCANNLGLVYQDLERLEEAETLFVDTLERRARRLGESHASTITSRVNLAGLYVATGQYARAQQLLDDAERHAESALPADHWLRGTIEQKRGECFRAVGRHADGEASLLRAHTLLASALGPRHHRCEKVASLLVELYDAMGNPDKAAQWRSQSAP